jgi:hypothetical protein
MAADTTEPRGGEWATGLASFLAFDSVKSGDGMEIGELEPSDHQSKVSRDEAAISASALELCHIFSEDISKASGQAPTD